MKRKEKLSNSIPIENYDDIFSYIFFSDKILSLKTPPKKFCSILLSKYNKDELTEIFGSYDYRYDNSEFDFFVWEVDFEEERYRIYTHDTKGTAIEIITDTYDRHDKSKIKNIKKFIDYLYEKIYELQ